MEIMGFVTKATHIAVYDAPVGTYEELSFRVHKFGERWLGVTTRAKAVLPYASCFRSVWQQRLQIRDATVSPVLPLSPPALVLLLIGLAGCSKDRGELALKEAASLIDLGACDSKEPQALAVLELEETTARMPSNPTYGENDCRENLPIGEPEGGETPLVDVSGPALAFITPSLPPMPIIPPTDGVSPENNMSKDDMSKDDMFEQGAVQQIASLPPLSEIPVMPNPQIADRDPSPEQEPVSPPKEEFEAIIFPPQAIQPAPESPAPTPKEEPKDEMAEQGEGWKIASLPLLPKVPIMSKPQIAEREPSPVDDMSPPIGEPEDEKPDRWEVRQDASLSLPSKVPGMPNPEIAEREPSPEQEPVSLPKDEFEAIIFPPQAIQPAPKNPSLSPEGEIAEDDLAEGEIAKDEKPKVEIAEDEKPKDEIAKDEKPKDEIAKDEMPKGEVAKDEMPDQEEVGQNPSLPPLAGIPVIPNPQIGEREPSPEQEPVSPPKEEFELIISPPRVIQPAPENSAPSPADAMLPPIEEPEDEMPDQEEVGQNPSLPPPSEIPVIPNPQIGEREPSPEQEPVSPPKEEFELIISPPRVIQPAPENSAPSPADAMLPPIEEPEDEMPDQEEVGQNPSLPPPSGIPVMPNPEIADREPSPEQEPVSPPKADLEDDMAEDGMADDEMPEDEVPDDEMPDQEEVGQNPSLPPPSEIPVIPNPQIADRDPSPEQEPVSPPKAEPKVIISPPRVIQPAPENSAPSPADAMLPPIEEPEDEMPDQEEVGQNPSLPPPSEIPVIPNPQIADRDPSPEQEPVSPPKADLEDDMAEDGMADDEVPEDEMPEDEMPEDEMPEDEMPEDEMLDQEEVGQNPSLPPLAGIPVIPNPQIADRDPSPEQEPVSPPKEEPEQTSGELSPPQVVEITPRNPAPPPIDGAPPIDVIPNRDGVPIIDDMPPMDELPQQVVIPQEPSHPQLPTIAKPQPTTREMPPEEKPEQTSGEMSPPQVAEITSRNPAPPPIDGAPPRGNTPPAERAWPKGLIPSDREPILLSDIRLSEDDDPAADDPAAAERAAAERVAAERDAAERAAAERAAAERDAAERAADDRAADDRAADDRAGDDRAGDDPAGNDPAGNDPAGNESDANPPPALPRQNQFPIVAPGNHNDATTPLVILGSNHFDQPTIGSAHGNIINLSTGGSVKNPQVATLGQGADHVIYGVGVGSLLNSWQPYDGAQKILNFDIGTDKLWFKQGRPSEGWVHDMDALLLRIHRGSISYETADSGTDGNPNHDIITSVVVAGPVHRSINLVFYQIELHFHQPDDQRAAFNIYSQKPNDFERGTLATFIEIMGDSFGMINDWNDLGYDEGTLPTENMPAIL